MFAVFISVPSPGPVIRLEPLSAYEPSGSSRRSLSGFNSMKQLGVILLPPVWDASSTLGYPRALNSPVPIYIPGRREACALSKKSILPREKPGKGLSPDCSLPSRATLTTRPPHLPFSSPSPYIICAARSPSWAPVVAYNSLCNFHWKHAVLIV